MICFLFSCNFFRQMQFHTSLLARLIIDDYTDYVLVEITSHRRNFVHTFRWQLAVRYEKQLRVLKCEDRKTKFPMVYEMWKRHPQIHNQIIFVWKKREEVMYLWMPDKRKRSKFFVFTVIWNKPIVQLIPQMNSSKILNEILLRCQDFTLILESKNYSTQFYVDRNLGTRNI